MGFTRFTRFFPLELCPFQGHKLCKWAPNLCYEQWKKSAQIVVGPGQRGTLLQVHNSLPPSSFRAKFSHFLGHFNLKSFFFHMLRFHPHMDVSKNSGTPKSSILIRISIINHSFWGFSPYFWKHPYVDGQNPAN